MAKGFNNEPQLGNDPVYLGYSKEFSRPRSIDYSGIFTGVGNAVKGVANAVDENNKGNIDDALYKGIDPIRDAQGVDVATNAATQDQGLFPASGKAPEGVNAHIDGVEKLQAAFDQGTLSPTLYWGKLNALSKQVRSQYPGYREYIDQRVSSIVGANPANALRSSVEQGFRAAQAAKQQEQDKVQNIVDRNLDILLRENPDMVANANKYTPAQVRLTVAQGQAKDLDIKRQRAEIDLQEAQGKLTAEGAQRAAQTELTDYVNHSITVGFNSLDKAVLAKLQTGQPLSPDERDQLEKSFTALETRFEVGMTNILTQHIGDHVSNYASKINDPAKLEAMKKFAMSPLVNIREAMRNGLMGTAKMWADTAKMMADKNMVKALGVESIAKLKVASDINPQLANNMALQNPEWMDASSKAILNLGLGEAITGEPINLRQRTQMYAPPDNRVDKQGRPNVAPNVMRQQVDFFSNIVVSKDAKDQEKINAIKSIWHRDNLDFLTWFDASSRREVYNRLIRPDVTQEVVRLSQQDPTILEQYSQWAGDGFKSVFKENADTVQDAVTFDQGVDVHWDPNQFKFSGALNPKFYEGWSKVNKGTPEDGFTKDRPAEAKAIENINMALKSLRPVLEAQGADKDPKALVKIISGIDVDTEKQDSFITKALRALGMSVGDDDIKPSGKKTDKSSEIDLNKKQAYAGDIKAGSLTELIEKVATEAGIDPRIMHGIRAGESFHTANYDVKDDDVESSWGPFQLNRNGGLGTVFERETGLDVRDPKTIPAQAKWVAEYIKKTGRTSPWRGYRGLMDPDPRWGESGFVPTSTQTASK